MIELVERMQREGLSTRQQTRTALKPVKKGARGRPRNFTFRSQPKEKSFSLSLQFRRAEVPRGDIVRALQAIIEDLLRQDAERARSSALEHKPESKKPPPLPQPERDERRGVERRADARALPKPRAERRQRDAEEGRDDLVVLVVADEVRSGQPAGQQVEHDVRRGPGQREA